MWIRRPTRQWSPVDVQGQPVAKKSRLICKTIIYDESIANQWLDEPPLEVWDHHIIPRQQQQHIFEVIQHVVVTTTLCRELRVEV